MAYSKAFKNKVVMYYLKNEDASLREVAEKFGVNYHSVSTWRKKAENKDDATVSEMKRKISAGQFRILHEIEEQKVGDDKDELGEVITKLRTLATAGERILESFVMEGDMKQAKDWFREIVRALDSVVRAEKTSMNIVNIAQQTINTDTKRIANIEAIKMVQSVYEIMCSSCQKKIRTKYHMVHDDFNYMKNEPEVIEITSSEDDEDDENNE